MLLSIAAELLKPNQGRLLYSRGCWVVKCVTLCCNKVYRGDLNCYYNHIPFMLETYTNYANKLVTRENSTVAIWLQSRFVANGRQHSQLIYITLRLHEEGAMEILSYSHLRINHTQIAARMSRVAYSTDNQFIRPPTITPTFGEMVKY